MKILLTGPTGFIGSAFTQEALKRGHSVGGLIIPAEEVPKHLPVHPNLSWFRGTLDETPWDEIKRFKADACLHMAWVTVPGIYFESPENFKFLESSVRFLRRVNELGTNYLVGLGSCIEYQIGNQKLSEDTPVIPTTTYARCKNELRQIMEADATNRRFGFCWTRIFYPYGPYEHPTKLCSSIIGKLSRGEQIVLKTPESTKDYIFRNDLAEALLTIVEKRFQGAINVGTGIGVTVAEIADRIGSLMGRRELIAQASPPETDPLGFVVGDVSRLENLGWAPKYDLQRGLETLVEFNLSAARG